jgi:hypothetical protein
MNEIFVSETKKAEYLMNEIKRLCAESSDTVLLSSIARDILSVTEIIKKKLELIEWEKTFLPGQNPTIIKDRYSVEEH